LNEESFLFGIQQQQQQHFICIPNYMALHIEKRKKDRKRKKVQKQRSEVSITSESINAIIKKYNFVMSI